MSGVHEFAKFETSPFTKFKRIHQVDPLTAVAPTPSSRGALAHEGALLGSKAELGDKRATETQSDEVPFWIIEVVGKEQAVPLDCVCPLTAVDHVDVIFEFPRGKMVLLARCLRSVVTLREELYLRPFGDGPLHNDLSRSMPLASTWESQVERIHDRASSNQCSTQRQRSASFSSCVLL